MAMTNPNRTPSKIETLREAAPQLGLAPSPLQLQTGAG
jgi:hypothetical protein